MPRRRTRKKVQSNVSLSGDKNKNVCPAGVLHFEDVNSDDMQCQVIYEDTSLSRLKTFVQQVMACKGMYGSKPTVSKVNGTPVSSSTSTMRKEYIGMPSKEVIVNPTSYIVLYESCPTAEKSAEPEVDVIYENTNKHTMVMWTENDTKYIMESLESLPTQLSRMFHLFNCSRSRDELKLKSKLEEKRNKDLTDKAPSPVSDVCQNSSAKKVMKVHLWGNTSALQNVSVRSTVSQPQARGRRARKFHFVSSSDEENSECKKSRKLTLSSQSSLSNPAKISLLEIKDDVCQLEEPHFLPKSAANAIHHPTVVRTGENDKKQVFDVHVSLNTEGEAEVLTKKDLRNVLQNKFNRTAVPIVPSECALSFSGVLSQEISSDTLNIRQLRTRKPCVSDTSKRRQLRTRKPRVSSKQDNNTSCYSASQNNNNCVSACQKVLRRRPRGRRGKVLQRKPYGKLYLNDDCSESVIDELERFLEFWLYLNDDCSESVIDELERFLEFWTQRESVGIDVTKKSAPYFFLRNGPWTDITGCTPERGLSDATSAIGISTEKTN